MLGVARHKNARFLLASTSETYGDPQVHPQPETYWGHVNPVGPRGVYDEAKRFGEAMTMAYRNYKNVNTAIVRIFNTFGERMRPNDGRAIPTFITQALRGEPITVAGEGLQTRSVCYVSDLVEGLIRLLYSAQPGPVNIGNPHELTVLQIAQLVKEMTGSSLGDRFHPPSGRRPDCAPARHHARAGRARLGTVGDRSATVWAARSSGSAATLRCCSSGTANAYRWRNMLYRDAVHLDARIQRTTYFGRGRQRRLQR